MSPAEKVETIVDAFLKGRVTTGALGKLVEVAAFENAACSFPACWRVVTDDGLCFIVRTTASGWSVRFGAGVGNADRVYEAARWAYQAGSAGPHNVSVLASVIDIKA